MARGLLMIHGVGCGGDVWERMLPAFEGAGFNCAAPTLFPEQRTVEDPPETLGQLGLGDYVEAMAGAARELCDGDLKPAVIGHSMGGLVAQKLAERGEVSAAVFLTPAAPAGCTVTSLSVLRTFWSVASEQRRGLAGRAVKIGRRGFCWGVLNAVPRARHDAICATARYDSGTVYADLMRPGPVEEGRIRIPTLTIGAVKDRATVIRSVRKVARKYANAATKGDYLEYPGHAHWIVDEPGTDLVTADIITWLNRKLVRSVGRPGQAHPSGDAMPSARIRSSYVPLPT